jgi:arylsulfatase A-like enzyme
VLADDLSTDLLAYMPNVRKMQRDGATFSNYFVTDSLCCPSRASIFTGRYPHNTGVLHNAGPDGGYPAFKAHGNEHVTFAVALHDAGYRTAMMGKLLNGYNPRTGGVAPGWDEWDATGHAYKEFAYDLNRNDRVEHHGKADADYFTDVVAELATTFVQRSGQDRFFIEVATFAPHAPYTPAPRDAAALPGVTAPRTAAFGVRANERAPAWLREIPALGPGDIAAIDADYRKRAQSVLAIDAMVGRLRDQVAALGIADRTYIVFSSDNGYHMGEYSLRPGKMTAFDTDVHVPLIVVGPGIAAGSVIDQIATNVDLCPTFIELARATAPATVDGRSLVPLLRGQTPARWRQAALVEHQGNDVDTSDPDLPAPNSGNPPTYAALRSKAALYVEYASGAAEYYDLAKDPLELSNIAATLSAATTKRLHDALRAATTCKGADECWNAQLAPVGP